MNVHILMYGLQEEFCSKFYRKHNWLSAFLSISFPSLVWVRGIKSFMDREVTACQGNPGDPVLETQPRTVFWRKGRMQEAKTAA